MSKRVVSFLISVSVLFTTIFIPAFNAGAAHVTQIVAPVSGGWSHSIAIKADGLGTFYGWGSNADGQLGKDATVKFLQVPEELEDNPGNIAVAAGTDFSLALRYDGSVYSIGSGGSAPVYRVQLPAGIVAIAAGSSDGLALDREGFVWQWTKGGQPLKVQSLKGIAAIAAGGFSFFALTHSGEVWAWGTNSSGELGDGTTNDAPAPKKARGLANIVYIAAGASHCLAISYDGSVYAWGSNTYGQLGDGTNEAHPVAVKVNGFKDAVIQVSAGNNTSMALTEKNELYTWGHGEYGQLGTGTTTISTTTPTKITTLGTPVFISSGANHNFYVSNEGDLYTWGRNANHQLGTGQETNETSPVKILSGLPTTPGEYMTDYLTDASPWSIPELTALYETNMLPPMLFGKYKENVTRAEFASLLVILYETIKGTVITYPEKSNFEDIENHVYEIEIKKAYALRSGDIHLVDGVSETRFNPEGQITRQEAAKMFVSFICIMQNFPIPTDILINMYKDVTEIGFWAVPYVVFAYYAEIMQGDGGYFRPRNNLTREQILAMVYRSILKYKWNEPGGDNSILQNSGVSQSSNPVTSGTLSAGSGKSSTGVNTQESSSQDKSGTDIVPQAPGDGLDDGYDSGQGEGVITTDPYNGAQI